MQKPAASLTAAILAKKGSAVPTTFASALSATPPPSPTDRQVKPLKLRVPGENGESDGKKIGRRKDRGNGGPRHVRRVTVRMEEVHHLRIRIAAAHLGISVQQLVLAALDAYLSEVRPVAGDGCACLEQEPQSGAPTGKPEQIR